MKQLLLFGCMMSSLLFSAQAQDKSLNVMTFNIRFNNPRDSANAWPNRKDFAASQILFHQAHIVGVQEALHDQLNDLLDRMPNYRYLGVGRDDGKQKGEYSAVFYDSTRLQALRSETFWLSETPNVAGSKSWDAAITRVVTWVLFKDRLTKKEFYHFNTHFDHIGKVARRSSATLLLNKVKEIAGARPAIITGDFNAHPTDEPIQVIVNANDPLRFTDSKEISKQPHYGPGGTFNAFGPKEVADTPIDYIFLKGKFTVLQHATLSQTWKGRFSSDHFPVIAKLLIL
jgi:endonuclease/exonuclease/phosphatase family metal-dependent hydrolase